ncbi:MAG: 2-dehydro-3-deoxygalactonokinase [Chitinophagales bacterium]
MHNFFLSCDWGTSNFRLKLVRAADQQVLEEVITKEGVAATYARWKTATGQHHIQRETFAMQVLRDNLYALGKKTTEIGKGLPVLISGMASSSIGIRELPYATLPFSLDGRNAVVQRIGPDEKNTQEIWLISGLKAAADVMRGEETQMIGLDAVFSAGKTVVSIFPGTHSKHIRVLEGKIVDFKTYMTGELFDLVSGNSLLKEAVSSGGQVMTTADSDAFDQGIARAATSNFLNGLFSVRVNHLFKSFSREQNYHYLSGLLIGTELKELTQEDPSEIQLCSGSHLFPLYQRGLEKLNLTKKTTFISPEMMDQSAAKGQLKIFQYHHGG